MNRWWLVVATGLAVFMGMLDTSAVNVALPALEREFSTRTSVSQWVVLGYLLPLIAMALPSGRWLDRTGRRAAMLLSTTGFVVASAAAGLAPQIGWLIAARIVQGACGAVLFSVATVLTTTAVRPEARGRAMGIVTTLGPLGAVCGPGVGGLLIEHLGWRWIFYLNVPIGVAVISVTVAQLAADGAVRLPGRAWLVETSLLATAAVIAMLALSLGATGGTLWLAGSLAAVPPLFVWLRQPVSRPVRELMRVRGVAPPHVALLVTGMATGSLMLLLPFYLERALRMPASAAGFTILVYPLAMAVVGLAAGALADRMGAKAVGVVGGIVQALGILLLMPLSREWSTTDVAWRLALVGLGNGLFTAPNMTLVMSASPRERLGTTSGTTGVARQLGFALGPAISTALWAAAGYTSAGMRSALLAATAFAAIGPAALAWASSDESRIAGSRSGGARRGEHPADHAHSHHLTFPRNRRTLHG